MSDTATLRYDDVVTAGSLADANEILVFQSVTGVPRVRKTNLSGMRAHLVKPGANITIASDGTIAAAQGAWLNGSGVPSSELGSAYDYYLRTSNGDLYQKSGGGTWSVIANLRGAPGTVETLSGANVTGDFSVNTNKFTVNGTTGNATVAGTMVVTGALTTSAGTTTKTLNIAPGAYDLAGQYAVSTAPLAMAMSLPRPSVTPLGKRNVVQWSIVNEVVAPGALANQGGSLNFFEVTQRSGYRVPLVTSGSTAAGNDTLNFAATTGVSAGMFIDDPSGGIPAGATVVSTTSTTVVSSAVAVGAGVASGATIAFRGAVADSWQGSRTVGRFTWTEDNHPVEYLSGSDGGSSHPSVNVLWSTIQSKYNRGGDLPTWRHSRGSNFLNYGMIHHISGSTNLTASRLYEGSLFFQRNTSVRAGLGWSVHTPTTDGTAPTEVYTAYTTRKSSNSNLAWRGVFVLGDEGFAGIDALRGTLLGYRAAHADPKPKAFIGIDLADVNWAGRAMRWIGGDIAGGAHTDAGAGRLRLGNGFLTPTATGLQIDAVGYRGSPAGTIFSLGGSLVNGNPGVEIRPNSVGDDAYGGTYHFYSPDYLNNRFNRVMVLNPPVTNGAAPSNPIEVKLRHNSGAQVEFPVTETATTTAHPTELTATSATAYDGLYLVYYTGVCAGERQLITGFDPATRILTTAAFSQVPTASTNLMTNFNFASVLPTVEDSILNGWQFTLNGGTGTVVRDLTNFTHARLTGDGTNAASLDQSITWPANSEGVLRIYAAGPYRVKLGTTRGDSDIYIEDVHREAPPEGEDYPRVFKDILFYSSGTTVWLRIETDQTIPARISNVRAADAASGSAILMGVRAGVEAVPLTVSHTWTQRNTLELQPGAGPATFGGTLGVAGNFAIATNKFTVAAASGDLAVNTDKFTVAGASGNMMAAGSATGASFIPSGSSVPSRGLYYPTTDTLGLAVSSTAKLLMTTAALSPATSGGMTWGTASLPWGNGFLASGAILNFAAGDVTLTHSSNLLALAGGNMTIAAAADTSLAINPPNGSAATLYLNSDTLSALSASAPLAFLVGGSERGRVTTSGRWLLGSATDDAATIVQVNGTFKATGAATLSGGVSATTGAFSGDVAVASNKFTVAAASGDTVVAGTLGVTGAATLSGGLITSTGAFSGNVAVATNKFTANATSGDIVAAGSATAASFIPSGSGVPSLGIYSPAGGQIGFASGTAAKLLMTSAAFSPATSGGMTWGTASLPWGNGFLASGAILNFANGDVTLTHASNLLTMEGGGFLMKGSRGLGLQFAVETFDTSAGQPGIYSRGRRGDSNTSVDFGGKFLAEAIRTDAMFAVNKVLGGLIFGGNTDLSPTMGYTASITGIADAAWVDASNAATAIVFRTGATAQAEAANISYGTERGRITSAGRWLLGGSTDDGASTVQVNGTLKATGSTSLQSVTATTISATALSASAISYVNLSGVALPTVSGYVLGLAAADSGATTLMIEAKAASPKITFRRANNNSASPATLAVDNIIGSIEARGHDGTAFTTSRATINFVAAQDWTTGAQGGKIEFRTTANGAITGAALRMTLENSGALLIGGSTDDGTNKLRVSGGISVDTGNTYKVNNVAVLGARKTGWTVATGTATRTTFDTATVTLADLAQRVKALIDDLHNTAGHGLIGT